MSTQAFEMDVNPVTRMLYVLQSGDGLVSTFRILPSLAVAAPDVAVEGYPTSIHVEKEGNFVYVLDIIGSAVIAFRAAPSVSPSAPPLVWIQTLPVDAAPTDLESDGRELYVSTTTQLRFG